MGDVQGKPWQASSAEEYLSRLHAIFLPHIVDGLTKQVVTSEKTAHDTKSPYNFVSFTEGLLVATLKRVEEEHAREIRHLRVVNEIYTLPAGLEHKKVPRWVKNPVLLCSDCRGLLIKTLKEINAEMPIDSVWWRDDSLSTADRVCMIAKRIKRLFNSHVDTLDSTSLRKPKFQGCIEVSVDHAATDSWVSSPHKTASLVGSIFRRHIAMGIKDEAMRFDYTLPGILPKDRKRLSRKFWDRIRRTLLEVIQRCEMENPMESGETETSLRSARLGLPEEICFCQDSKRVEVHSALHLAAHEGKNDRAQAEPPPGQIEHPTTDRPPRRIQQVLQKAAKKCFHFDIGCL